MHRLQFAIPARIAAAPDRTVTEIYSVEEALDFLHDWPARRRGPLFQAAFNACFGATVDLVPVEEAWRTFAAFCRASGVAARDMMVPPASRARSKSLRH